MVRGSPIDAFWSRKIAQFKEQQNRSCSECSSFLLDILQGLYADISEAIKIEFLVILQEHGGALIQGQELAEQAVGSITSILSDLLTSNHHDIDYVTHCLVTITTLVVQFDLDKFNPQLVDGIIKILIKTCMKSNVAGETLTRKVACECLLELENTTPSILKKYVYQFHEIAKLEKTFASQNFLLLLSTVLCHSLEDGSPDVGIVYDENSDMLSSRIMARDIQQMTSYISGEIGFASPTVSWHIGQNIGFLFKAMSMPKVVLHNKMMKCCYSSDLQVLHLGMVLAFGVLQTTVTLEDLQTISQCLLRVIRMPQFPTGIRAMCLEWFLETIQQMDFMGNVEALVEDASCEIIKPMIFDGSNIKRGKVELLSGLLTIYPQARINFLASLTVLLKPAFYGLAKSDLSVLYRAAYIRCLATENENERQIIIEQLVKVTFNTPSFMTHIVDLVTAISDERLVKIRQNLVQHLAKHVLKLNIEEFLPYSDYYFPVMEIACREKGLWPMGIIKWLGTACKKSQICKLGDWQLGSNILLICRSVLGTHDSAMLLQELADFLWYLHRNYNDHDIKDRALFYYLVIGHASPKYFVKLFANAEVESKMQSMNKRGEIEIPSDLVRGVLPTIRIENEFLYLCKQVKHKADRISALVDNVHDDISRYFSMLDSKEFDKNIYLKLKVNFSGKHLDDGPNKVYALTLKFNSNGYCKEIPEVHIPYMSKNSLSKFPTNEHAICIKLEPEYPTPFAIQMSCLFLNEEERVCVAPMDPLQLVFADIFNPLIRAVEDIDSDARRKTLFTMLWSHFTHNQRKLSSTGNSCALSLKRLVIPERKIISAIQAELSPFVVDQEKGVYKVGIFLPPKYHFLMILKLSTEETQVRFCVDDWKLLDTVESYLDTFADKVLLYGGD